LPLEFGFIPFFQPTGASQVGNALPRAFHNVEKVSLFIHNMFVMGKDRVLARAPPCEAAGA
jgi:hypothetical protein